MGEFLTERVTRRVIYRNKESTNETNATTNNAIKWNIFIG